MLMCLEEEMKMPRKKKTEDAAASATTAAGTASAKENTTKAKTAAAKSAEVKTAEKKSAAKKPACKTSVCVEMSGLSVSINDIQTAVKKAVKDKGLDASELNIYINAAEQAAYYTINGEGGEDFKVDLKNL